MDISELLSSISDEDMKKLRETAQSLLSGQSSSDNTQSSSGMSAMPGIDPKLLSSVGRIAGMMNRPDPRCDFLMSLKPLLSSEKQSRVDSAVQMLRMLTVIPQISGGQNR